MKKVLVTGGNGQLGSCIRDAAQPYRELQLVFVDVDELDICDPGAVEAFFAELQPDYCINAAAYTNVEKAESEADLAFAVNAFGAGNVARACAHNDTVLLHISTDYVFDGKTTRPYLEKDATHPINAYGQSKLKGEQLVEESGCKYFIFRTSWLYSQYGHNFMKTVLRLVNEGKPLTVTTEQTGVPTNANDLADALIKVIGSGNTEYGLYHFSNSGTATWYDFAEAIISGSGLNEKATLAKTNHYRTFAARPAYSVLNTDKAREQLGIEVVDWRGSLKQLLEQNN